MIQTHLYSDAKSMNVRNGLNLIPYLDDVPSKSLDEYMTDYSHDARVDFSTEYADYSDDDWIEDEDFDKDEEE